MGLRFSKRITLFKGVNLNLSKSGIGVSAGVPGLRASINSKGQVRGTAGIPGTGVSYVKTKTLGKSKSKAKSDTKTDSKTSANKASKAVDAQQKLIETSAENSGTAAKLSTVQIDASSLKSIHSVADTAVDWDKALQSPTPENSPFDPRTSAYLHTVAKNVLSGDIDTYLQVIEVMMPLEDLLDYGENFEFGTDNPGVIEVEFVINEAVLSNAEGSLSVRDYNLLLQDFVCSMSLRIARDMFALLPVKNTIVHVVLGGATVFSADFDRASFDKLNFSYIDPSNTATKFRCNIDFDEKKGFSEVIPL